MQEIERREPSVPSPDGESSTRSGRRPEDRNPSVDTMRLIAIFAVILLPYRTLQPPPFCRLWAGMARTIPRHLACHSLCGAVLFLYLRIFLGPEDSPGSKPRRRYSCPLQACCQGFLLLVGLLCAAESLPESSLLPFSVGGERGGGNSILSAMGSAATHRRRRRTAFMVSPGSPPDCCLLLDFCAL